MSSSAGWKRAPKPKNIEQFNKHPYNSSLANGPASSQSGPSSKLAASRGLMARGLNPVLGFMVIGTLAWCSFQMLTESRAGKEKERGIASVQNPMLYDPNMAIDKDYYPGKGRRLYTYHHHPTIKIDPDLRRRQANASSQPGTSRAAGRRRLHSSLRLFAIDPHPLRVLCVTENPAIAEQLAWILGAGREEMKSLPPAYTFDHSLSDGSLTSFFNVSSVVGPLVQHDFDPDAVKDDASPGSELIVENLEEEAKKHDPLLI
ncbi:hypothetical protein BDY24DRAFT_419089 [Mrakia frigida]|uniref:uncharacterized protein n=1 Tax=Mrakia frigida TaxID=29902 RepID=UPI003FCC0803